MTQAYVGKGLPKFTYRKLLAKARTVSRGRRNSRDIKEWHRKMKEAYKDATGKKAPSEYDCSDLLVAMNAMRWSNTRPCMSGVLTVFCQMMPTQVAAAIARNVYKERKSFKRGRDFRRYLSARLGYDDIPQIQAVLKRAQKK